MLRIREHPPPTHTVGGEYHPDLPGLGTQMCQVLTWHGHWRGRAGPGGPKVGALMEARTIGWVFQTTEGFQKARRYRDSRSRPTHSKGTKVFANVNIWGPQVLPRWGGRKQVS